MNLLKLILKYVPDQISNKIGGSLLSYRGLENNIIDYPNNIITKIFTSKYEEEFIYYPCDLIELMNIINQNKIFNTNYLCFLNFNLSKEYFNEYPLLLKVKLKIDKNNVFGGLYFINDSKISFNKEDIRYVYLRDNKLIDKIKSLKIEFGTLNSIFSKDNSKIKLSIKDKIPGGLGDNVPFSDFSPKKIEKGKKIELEHTDDPEIAKEIAKDHLVEDINYYEKLEKMEKKAQSMENNVKIELTPLEKNIFSFILAAKNHFPQTKNVIPRIAGGWVRDHLMDVPSDDIDCAIDKLSGVEFVQYLKKYDQLIGDGKVTGGIHSTSLNKTGLESDALQVAALSIFGQMIEFVNLRTEEYSDTSRVPKIVATNDPASDATRRDLTINSLYYNLETGQIEDYTGGLQDLKDMKLRTPIIKNMSTEEVTSLLGKIPSKEEYDKINQLNNAREIFKQDPLRILRTLRFYSRYNGSTIDPSVVEAMKDPQVASMYKKLAPERSAKEIRKMFQGDQAVQAAHVLFDTDLYKLVFGVPENWHPIKMDQQNRYHNLSLMDHVVKVMQNLDEMTKKMNLPKEEKGLLLMAAFFHDFGKMHPEIRKEHPKYPGFMQYIGHEDESAKFVNQMMTKMGFEPDERKFVTTISSLHMEPHNFEKLQRPKDMGKFLKDADKYWKQTMWHSVADSTGKGYTDEELKKIREERASHYLKLDNYNNAMGNSINKPIIDGNKVKQLAMEVAPDLVNKNAMIQLKGHNKPMHYMTLLMDKLIKSQHERMVDTPQFEQYLSTLPENERANLAKNVLTPEKAELFIRGEVKNLYNLWKQQQKEKDIIKNTPKDNNMANNLFSIYKQADASSDQGPDGFGGGPISYEGKTPFQQVMDSSFPNPKDKSKLESTDHIYHTKNTVPLPFQKGDTVRLKDTGLAFNNQSFGKVVKTTPTHMWVTWESGKYKDKTTKHDITRLEILFSLFTKIN
jgi:tRNA nucleotidyltransferase/poly(A) polymerase